MDPKVRINQNKFRSAVSQIIGGYQSKQHTSGVDVHWFQESNSIHRAKTGESYYLQYAKCDFSD